ncbi:hypothetical protein ACFLRF_05230 [Candidatus Altiarchaeota archaeon]
MIKALDSELAFELKRQSIHMIGGITISLLTFLLKPIFGRLVVIPLITGILVFLAVPKILPKAWISQHLLYHFERKKDIESFPYKGAIYFGVGIITPLLFLPTLPACAIIIILAVGDAFSTVGGKFFGRYHLKGKTIEGFVSFVGTGFIASLVYVDHVLGFTLAFIGGIIELMPRIDDNISIPIVLSISYLLLH